MIRDLADIARWWAMRLACRALRIHSTSCRGNPRCLFRIKVR